MTPNPMQEIILLSVESFGRLRALAHDRLGELGKPLSELTQLEQGGLYLELSENASIAYNYCRQLSIVKTFYEKAVIVSTKNFLNQINYFDYFCRLN
jgi:hypothetical protein